MYVNAFLEDDDVVIIERIDGERIIRREPVDWSFYVKDNNGQYDSIYGDKLRKVSPRTKKEYYGMKKQFDPRTMFESDVNRVHKYLSENYGEEDFPELKIGYFDIEVGYNEENKYSNSDDAKNEIISVAVTDKDTEETRILVLPPETLSYNETVDIVNKVTDKGEVFATEPDLINRMLELLEPFDVISGWNSESYDVKYIINRIHRIMNPDVARKLCMCDKEPKPKTVYNHKFKKEEEFYELVGRVHLDYMELYKKYTYNEVPGGYSLDNIAYMELDENKVPYSGTLDQLYKQDFEKFVRYNIQDTELILRLDKKLKFIDTTNIRAHQNGVVLQAAMGTVGIVEQAILNEGHRYYGSHFDDKKEIDGDVSGAAGAFVIDPKKGIRRYVAGNDINSLYPSVIRSLNMSPETIVGQVSTDRTDRTILELVESGKAETFAEAWRTFFSTLEFEEVINQTDTEVEFEIDSTKEVVYTTGKKIYDMVYSNDDLCISANGTVFNRRKKGIIPHLLERWYSDRKKMQADAGEWEGKMMAAEPDSDEYHEAKYWYEYWDQRQLAKKIDLNSLYGALLNKHCRFYDKRLGQSTTLTGRSITRHMAAKINEIITGEYDYLGKSIIYGDSVSKDTIIQTSLGDMTVEKAYTLGNKFWCEPKTNKEYSVRDDMKVKTYDPESNKEYLGDINYIYRHKTNKSRWKITDSEGNEVIVTGDHSIMVERDNTLQQVKPSDLTTADVLVSIKYGVVKTNVGNIEQLDDYQDEYVYDVGMTNHNHNWFFGNNILVKNTDSVPTDTNVRLEHGNVEIGKLFHDSLKSAGDVFHLNDSEYVFPKDMKAITFNNQIGENEVMEIDYVYRHKVEKELFEIEDECGNIVTVTEDHSIMVERDGQLMEMKPLDIMDDDILISL